VATIEEEEGNEVWGVLWQLSIDDLPKLDKQEGVPKLYRRKEVEVDIESSGLTKAVTYQLTVPKLDDRRPSKIYRQKRKKLKRTQNCGRLASSPGDEALWIMMVIKERLRRWQAGECGRLWEEAIAAQE